MRFLAFMLFLAALPPGMASAAQPAQKAEPAKTLAADLSAPVALQSASKPISVDVGHAAPFVADLGQGKMALLVGQFGGGKLRMYPLTKNGNSYDIGDMGWVKGGTVNCAVPSG